MSRSPFRSCTSPLLTCIAASGLAACGSGGDETCGPGDAPVDGITAKAAGVDLVYGGFRAGPNNDCPDPGDPGAPTSFTIFGAQVAPIPSTFPLTLCIRRPDRFGDTAATLGVGVTTAGIGAVIEDLSAVIGECAMSLDREGPAPTGTATATGFCARGTDPAGFALELAGEVSVIKTCGTALEQVRLVLAGRVAVGAIPPTD